MKGMVFECLNECPPLVWLIVLGGNGFEVLVGLAASVYDMWSMVGLFDVAQKSHSPPYSVVLFALEAKMLF